MKKFDLLSLFLLMLCLPSCDMWESHPYDAHITGERNLNEKNIRKIESAFAGRTSFRFALISDTQRWYDETEELVKDINRQGDIDFVIHTGDYSDFGATKEFLLQRDILLDLKMPWVGLLGNHDCLGTGEDVYRKVWGNPNFYFTVGNVLFICLNTNAMEYDYSEPVPDFTFMEDLMNHLPEGVEKTIVAMHVPPFDEVFNNNVAKVFQLYLKTFPNLLFCMNGHAHSYQVSDLFDDGILYYQTPCAKKRGYIVFTINENGYEHELVEY